MLYLWLLHLLLLRRRLVLVRHVLGLVVLVLLMGLLMGLVMVVRVLRVMLVHVTVIVRVVAAVALSRRARAKDIGIYWVRAPSSGRHHREGNQSTTTPTHQQIRSTNATAAGRCSAGAPL